RDLVERDAAAVARGEDEASVGREGERVHDLDRTPVEPTLELTRRGVPDRDPTVVAAAEGDVRAVGRVGHRVSPAVLTRADRELLPALQTDEAEEALLRAHERAARADERPGADRERAALERAQGLARVEVPVFHDAPLVGREESPLVRRERDAQ